MSTELDTLLAFADDEHLMGQHHTEWIGVAPFLEEDLAFSSIAQDELGHAAALYELVLERHGREPTEAAVDELAYRSGNEYRSCALAEYTTTDWAEALVRHWIYDAAEALRWEALASSSDDKLRDLAAIAERDESFHRRHADALLDQLFASAEARSRVLEALDALLPLVPGVLAGASDEQVARLAAATSGRFGVEVELRAVGSDTRLERSDDFAPLMARMREVVDLDASAVW